VSMAILKLAAGRGRELHPLTYVFAAALLGRYLL
jgi:xanthine/uracil/vitamin C permease (AzgA family)